MTLLIQFAMIFFGTLMVAGLLALGEPQALKEAVTTHGGLASVGPQGWACKGADALLRTPVNTCSIDRRPRLASAPLQTQRGARLSAAQTPRMVVSVKRT